MGKLEAIWLKRARGGPMDPVDEAFAVEGRGLRGGADFGRDRQVTLIEREVFERLKAELDDSVTPVMRRSYEGLMDALAPHWGGRSPRERWRPSGSSGSAVARWIQSEKRPR